MKFFFNLVDLNLNRINMQFSILYFLAFCFAYSQAIVCPPNYCKTATCMQINSKECVANGGVFIKNGGYCGCCDSCPRKLSKYTQYWFDGINLIFVQMLVTIADWHISRELLHLLLVALDWNVKITYVHTYCRTSRFWTSTIRTCYYPNRRS